MSGMLEEECAANMEFAIQSQLFLVPRPGSMVEYGFAPLLWPPTL